MTDTPIPPGGACCGGPVPAVRWIEVGGEMAGITGLDAVLEQLYLLERPPDAPDIGKELLDMIRMRNYIPPGTEKLYTEALIREYAAYCAARDSEQTKEESRS